MSKKKKNVKVSASATLPSSSSRNDNFENKEISVTDDYEYDSDDTSSDSGKSEFDEDYERNRPPIVPIDRSRVRRVNKIPNTTNIDNASCNIKTIKENETLPDIKISKSKKKRLRRRQRQLKNEKINDTSTITIETELPGKQESNDIIVIETLSRFYQGFIETLSTTGNDKIENNKIDYESDKGNSSSNSGKDEFDEDYERNRPPIVPIDQSRVRQVNKIPNATNIETIKENETLPDIKISKSKKKRLRRRQRRLINEKINDTSTITIETELPDKQESNDVILIETLSTTGNDKIENNKIDYESDKGNSSSNSGKDEFDEDYERNRPPIVPIDRSSVRQVATSNIETIKDNGTLSEIKISKSKRKRLRRQQRRLEYLQKSNGTLTTNIKQESDNGIVIEQKIDDTIVGRKVKTKNAKKRNSNRKNVIDAPLTYAEVLKKEFVRVEGLVDVTAYELWASTSNSYCKFLAFIECIEGAKWTIQYDHFPALVDAIDRGLVNMGKYRRNRRDQRPVSLAQSLETDNERNNIKTLTKTGEESLYCIFFGIFQFIDFHRIFLNIRLALDWPG